MIQSRKAVYFTGRYEIEIRVEPISRPGEGQLLVQTAFSGISPGTEMLIYRGEAPENLAADSKIESLAGTLAYPLKYGYACVGHVIEIGPGVETNWLGIPVFSFQPHQTFFLAAPGEVIPIPVDIALEAAAVLPNMETAINLILDGRPKIGDRVAVFGQGILGLLTTSLLVKFPLERVAVFDPVRTRRERAASFGVRETIDPDDSTSLSKYQDSFDLVYELSGAPKALDQAIQVTGFAGRVVVGSWYGKKIVPLQLGGHFHRNRIELVSSQVSSISPELTGRWDPARRIENAWHHLRSLQIESLITHKVPFAEAKNAFQLLARHPGQTLQVLLTYPDHGLEEIK